MTLKQNNGFTLVELLLAVMILAGSISGILLLFTTSMVSSEQAWDITVATSHAESVLEEMQRLDSRNKILAVNWNQWAIGQGLNILPNELIDVTYGNQAGDPLEIAVRVSWLKKARMNDITINTRLTK